MRVVGVDFAAAMLAIAHDKVRARSLQARMSLVRGDAMRCRSRGSCDAASIGFGIRNVDRPERAIAELARILCPGGRLAILEFGFPRSRAFARSIGSISVGCCRSSGAPFSRHGDAYSYLPASVEAFQSPQAFSRPLESAGFTAVRAVLLTLGIVYLFVATRPEARS